MLTNVDKLDVLLFHEPEGDPKILQLLRFELQLSVLTHEAKFTLADFLYQLA